MLFCKVELMLVSLLNFLDNAYSGSARSTLLRESSNQMVGIARHLYLMNGEFLINGKIIENSEGKNLLEKVGGFKGVDNIY